MKLEKRKTLKKYIEQSEHNFDCTAWLNNCPNK